MVLIGYGVGAYFGAASDVEPHALSTSPAVPVAPHPALAPGDVVALQLEGLRRETGDLTGTAQCFAFASPLNRQATGPLERFAAMIAAPPYDVLYRSNLTTIGEAQLDGDQAVVTVAIVSRDRGLHLFRFLLSRQQQAPLTGCWMTDAVYLLGVARHEAPGPAIKDEPPI